MITLTQFKDSVGCTLMTASAWYEPICNAMLEFGIEDGVEMAAYLAQIGHESRSLSQFEENLDYSAARLLVVFPNRFRTMGDASLFSHRPEALANHVYSERYGNRSKISGDGWKYRGRGPKQITFAANYKECGRALNLPLIERPEILLETKQGARSSGWYWLSRKCKETAADVVMTTRKVQGGKGGLEDRTSRFEKAKRILGVK